MDFFAHQEAARRSTRRLVAYFALAVAAIVAVVYTAVRLIFAGVLLKQGADVPPFWDPAVFALTAAAVLAVILAGSLYKIVALRQGGDAVAWMLGGRLVDPATRDHAERRLLNVVEEMAIASGVPVPNVYVMDKEKGINAFAAGFSPQEAVIGVTDGTLRLLSRDELQGVIAHEFSHLLNGDMRLNLRLIGILHGILVIALIGYMILRSLRFTGGGGGRSSKKGGGGQLVVAILLFGAVLMAVGYIGVFFGRLIKSAVSRQREFLADAAAVQFTRNPGGLAGALQKIGGYGSGSKLTAPKAEEASHMFFGDALKPRMFAALATHPPLEQRIRRVQPAWDGEYPKIDYPTQSAAEAKKAGRGTAKERAAAVAGAAVAAATAAAGGVGAGVAAATAGAGAGADSAAAGPGVLGGAVLAGAAAGAAAAGGGAPPVTPDEVAARVGTLTEAHLAYAAALLDRLPEPVREATHEPEGAEAVVYSLLLDRDPAIREAQLTLLRERAEPAAFERTLALQAAVVQCPVEARLPLVDLALPSLAKLSLGRYETFLATVEALVAADRRIDLFEYALKRLFASHLAPRFQPRPPRAAHYYKLDRLGPQVSILLSALVHSGHAETDAAARAFDRAAAELPAGIGGLTLAARDTCGMAEIDRALADLDRTTPQLKRHLVRAATAAVAFDGRVTIAEGELLRAVADGLGVPVPPFLPGQVAA